ncbi:MAG: hypothetical protein JW954_04385 [Dehalococcoidaceae bacterium]|nr:hypothetical protein [Dehalococcoidaceae bacterium]
MRKTCRRLLIAVKCFFRAGFAGMLLLAVVFSFTSCALTVYPVPVYQSAPQILPLEKLLSDYAADPVAAAVRYKGKTFLFPGIEAENVLSNYINSRATLNELFLQNGSVRFRPKYIYSLDSIGPDFVVDVVGDVQGWIQGYFYIDNCSYAIVKGGDLPPTVGY